MSKSEVDIQLELLRLGIEVSKFKEKIKNMTPSYTPKISLGDKESLELLDNKIKRVDLFSPNVSDCSVASIDTSSKILRTTFLDLVVVGGTLYSTERDKIVFPFDAGGRYLGIASYLELIRTLKSSLNSPDLAFHNVLGYEFALDEVDVVTKEGVKRESLYHLDDVADELRLEAENVLIRQVKEKLLVLDGPLFPTPIELSYSFQFGIPEEKDKIKHWGRLTHRWAYAALIKERLELIKGKDVVGVVKRLENSKKLKKTKGIANLIGSISVPDLSDAEILELISETQCSSVIGLCLVGPLEIKSEIYVKREDTDQVILEPKDIPTRYAYYAILKIPSGVQSFFRVESTSQTVLDSSIGVIFSNITSDILPTYISVVDNYSKRVAKSLFYISFNVLKDFITILHDSKLEAISISKEISSGLA
ncbi:DNA double-strand break repair nuclease NurA [Stygiolobus azoricus]|uniref:NurA domain-containing protein n=1 Tax=Stygiolobus azoricus TaxID=41675 RepID=A0A650CP42_9CREN|nr:DNA double-strand break repair nuclease NurA [Stygiolobus azoricus]QGR19558.1 hypothetical protein D1868_05845 [Stygiolobus azoricus]